MFVTKRRFYNFISLSIATHLALALSIFAFIPKHERFVPIEIHFGELGHSGTGSQGKSHGRPNFKTTSIPSAPLAPKEAKKSPITQEKPVDKVPHPQDGESVTKKAEGPTSTREAIGGPASSASGNGVAGDENGQSGMGGAGEATPLSRYVQKIVLLIEGHKNYPSRAKYLGQEGTVSLKLILDRDGKVLEVQILESPPFKLLQEAAMNIISEIGTFPPMPADVKLDTLTLNVPIKYRLVE